MKTPMEAALDNLTWEPVPPPAEPLPDLPYPTHRGILNLGDCELECFVLNNGVRVISEESIVRFFGVTPVE